MMIITTITTMKLEIMSCTHHMDTMEFHTTAVMMNGTPDMIHSLMDMTVILVAMITILITTPLSTITRIQLITLTSMQMV